LPLSLQNFNKMQLLVGWNHHTPKCCFTVNLSLHELPTYCILSIGQESQDLASPNVCPSCDQVQSFSIMEYMHKQSYMVKLACTALCLMEHILLQDWTCTYLVTKMQLLCTIQPAMHRTW